MADQLLCETSRRKITPPVHFIPNLCGLRDNSFGGILDDLYVRVIALGNGDAKALIVAFDLDKALYPAENLARISERTGIPVENIFF
jgi:neutral ceramidase